MMQQQVLFVIGTDVLGPFHLAAALEGTARRMASVFQFLDYHVTVLAEHPIGASVNQATLAPTHVNIQNTVRSLSSSTSLVVYFLGHGAWDSNGNAGLETADAHPDRPNKATKSKPTTYSNLYTQCDLLRDLGDRFQHVFQISDLCYFSVPLDKTIFSLDPSSCGNFIALNNDTNTARYLRSQGGSFHVLTTFALSPDTYLLDGDGNTLLSHALHNLLAENLTGNLPPTPPAFLVDSVSVECISIQRLAQLIHDEIHRLCAGRIGVQFGRAPWPGKENTGEFVFFNPLGAIADWLASGHDGSSSRNSVETSRSPVMLIILAANEDPHRVERIAETLGLGSVCRHVVLGQEGEVLSLYEGDNALVVLAELGCVDNETWAERVARCVSSHVTTYAVVLAPMAEASFPRMMRDVYIASGYQSSNGMSLCSPFQEEQLAALSKFIAEMKLSRLKIGVVQEAQGIGKALACPHLLASLLPLWNTSSTVVASLYTIPIGMAICVGGDQLIEEDAFLPAALVIVRALLANPALRTLAPPLLVEVSLVLDAPLVDLNVILQAAVDASCRVRYALGPTLRCITYENERAVVKLSCDAVGVWALNAHLSCSNRTFAGLSVIELRIIKCSPLDIIRKPPKLVDSQTIGGHDHSPAGFHEEIIRIVSTTEAVDVWTHEGPIPIGEPIGSELLDVHILLVHPRGDETCEMVRDRLVSQINELKTHWKEPPSEGAKMLKKHINRTREMHGYTSDGKPASGQSVNGELRLKLDCSGGGTARTVVGPDNQKLIYPPPRGHLAVRMRSDGVVISISYSIQNDLSKLLQVKQMSGGRKRRKPTKSSPHQQKHIVKKSKAELVPQPASQMTEEERARRVMVSAAFVAAHAKEEISLPDLMPLLQDALNYYGDTPLDRNTHIPPLEENSKGRQGLAQLYEFVEDGEIIAMSGKPYDYMQMREGEIYWALEPTVVDEVEPAMGSSASAPADSAMALTLRMTDAVDVPQVIARTTKVDEEEEEEEEEEKEEDNPHVAALSLTEEPSLSLSPHGTGAVAQSSPNELPNAMGARAMPMGARAMRSALRPVPMGASVGHRVNPSRSLDTISTKSEWAATAEQETSKKVKRLTMATRSGGVKKEPVEAGRSASAQSGSCFYSMGAVARNPSQHGLIEAHFGSRDAGMIGGEPMIGQHSPKVCESAPVNPTQSVTMPVVDNSSHTCRKRIKVRIIEMSHELERGFFSDDLLHDLWCLATNTLDGDTKPPVTSFALLLRMFVCDDCRFRPLLHCLLHLLLKFRLTLTNTVSVLRGAVRHGGINPPVSLVADGNVIITLTVKTLTSIGIHVWKLPQVLPKTASEEPTL